MTKKQYHAPGVDDKARSKNAKKSRRKGANGEREVVTILRNAGLTAERRAPLQHGAGSNSADIHCAELGRIECKRRKRSFKRFYDWLDDVDAIVMRDDRHQWLIVRRLDNVLTEAGK